MKPAKPRDLEAPSGEIVIIPDWNSPVGSCVLWYPLFLGDRILVMQDIYVEFAFGIRYLNHWTLPVNRNYRIQPYTYVQYGHMFSKFEMVFSSFNHLMIRQYMGILKCLITLTRFCSDLHLQNQPPTLANPTKKHVCSIVSQHVLIFPAAKGKLGHLSGGGSRHSWTCDINWLSWLSTENMFMYRKGTVSELSETNGTYSGRFSLCQRKQKIFSQGHRHSFQRETRWSTALRSWEVSWPFITTCCYGHDIYHKLSVSFHNLRTQKKAAIFQLLTSATIFQLIWNTARRHFVEPCKDSAGGFMAPQVLVLFHKDIKDGKLAEITNNDNKNYKKQQSCFP